MKRYIKASSSRQPLLVSDDGMFELYETSGVGVEDTPWKGLVVKSNGLADKHVVQVRLKSNFPEYNGQPVTYKYLGTEVAHGMRNSMDTLDETAEYIEVLESALKFAHEVEDWLPTTEYYRYK